MADWREYVERFYRLAPEEQQREWEKLSPDQRARFEAARVGLEKPATQAPQEKATRRSPGRALAIGCAAVGGVALLGFLGLVLLGIFVGSPDSESAGDKATHEIESSDPKAALVELEALIQDPEQSAAARREARQFLQRFPDSPEAARVEELLPQLETAVLEQERRQEERRRQEQEQARQRALAAKWGYEATSDEMTGRTSRRAAIRSENTVNFDFPYQGAQRASLILRTHPSYGRDVIFSIEKGQLLCRSIDRCQVRIRFDEGQPQTWTARPPADHSTTTLFLQGYDRFVQQMRRSEVVRIQPEVYQEGNPVFEFQVAGYDHSRYTGS